MRESIGEILQRLPRRVRHPQARARQLPVCILWVAAKAAVSFPSELAHPAGAPTLRQASGNRWLFGRAARSWRLFFCFFVFFFNKEVSVRMMDDVSLLLQGAETRLGENLRPRGNLRVWAA